MGPLPNDTQALSHSAVEEDANDAGAIPVEEEILTFKEAVKKLIDCISSRKENLEESDNPRNNAPLNNAIKGIFKLRERSHHPQCTFGCLLESQVDFVVNLCADITNDHGDSRREQIIEIFLTVRALKRGIEMNLKWNS